MTQAQVQTKSKYASFITQGADWKVFASFAFHRLGTIREAIAAGRIRGDGVVVEVTSSSAARFSDAIVTNFGAGALSLSCDVCVLGNEIIEQLSGSTMTPPIVSVAFGLVQADGKISPVVFSHKYVLFQRSGGMYSTLYTENTDFVGLFKTVLAPLPSKFKQAADIFIDVGLGFE